MYGLKRRKGRIPEEGKEGKEKRRKRNRKTESEKRKGEGK